MSKFLEAIKALEGKKARFFLGGGDRGWIQGPIRKVDGNLLYIEKDGEIRGTLHCITVNADAIRYFEMDRLKE